MSVGIWVPTQLMALASVMILINLEISLIGATTMVGMETELQVVKMSMNAAISIFTGSR